MNIAFVLNDLDVYVQLCSIEDNNNQLNIKSKSNNIDLEGKILIPNSAPVGSYAKNNEFLYSRPIYIGEMTKCTINDLHFKLTMADGSSSIFAHTGTNAFSERNSILIQLLFVPKGMDLIQSNLF